VRILQPSDAFLPVSRGTLSRYGLFCLCHLCLCLCLCFSIDAQSNAKKGREDLQASKGCIPVVTFSFVESVKCVPWCFWFLRCSAKGGSLSLKGSEKRDQSYEDAIHLSILDARKEVSNL
jgi:hypothetical protein